MKLKMTKTIAVQTGGPPFGEKAPVCREVREANGWAMPDPREQRETQRNEQHDGDDLDHREPVLDAAETAHTAGIHKQQGRAEHGHP